MRFYITYIVGSYGCENAGIVEFGCELPLAIDFTGMLSNLEE